MTPWRAFQQANWQRTQLRQGRCPGDGRPLAPGKRSCARCLAQGRKREKARYCARKRAGRCRHCSQPIVKGNTVFCARHRRLHNERNRQQRMLQAKDEAA